MCSFSLDKSCLSNLFGNVERVNKIVKCREIVGIKYLDIQKAFDQAPTQRHLGSISALCRTQEVRSNIFSYKNLELKKKMDNNENEK